MSDVVSLESHWVPLERGTLPRLLVLRGELEANDIPVDIPEASLGAINPFWRGRGNSFDYELRVPAPCAVAARSLIGVWERDVLESEELRVHGVTGALASQQDSGLRDLHRLSIRMRWCSLHVVTAPFGLWLALRYARDPARRRLPRRERWFDRAAIAVACVITIADLTLLALALDVL